MTPAFDRLPGGRSILLALAAAPAWLLVASVAHAIELFDGRIQVHGYGETQLRTIARNYDPANDYDLTQWYLIGNVELEIDVAPQGFGPFDLVSAFVRVEGRYDCVWTRACGLFQSVDTYGDRSDRLPEQLSDGQKILFRGTLLPEEVRLLDADGNEIFWNFNDPRRRISIPLGQNGDEFAVEAPPGSDPDTFSTPRGVPRNHYTGRLWHVPALGEIFFSLPGLDPNGVDGNRDPNVDPGSADDDISGCRTDADPGAPPCRYAGAYVAERFLGYRFGVGSTRGPLGGQGSRVFGPWRPRDRISAWGSLRDRVNPYDPDALHPVLVDFESGSPITGQGALPFRPAAAFAADSNGDGEIDAADEVGPYVSRGLYYPSARLADAIGESDFDQPKVNFEQDDLALNYGDAQEQTHELKEAYLDIELLDHSLWLRLGRQTIIWGKTELFRSQDQFNPQDLGLSSLPSLEESRVPLWAARGIYSFYDVGPFKDVRLEGALLIDKFQPIDLGRCGEPYAPPQACDLAFGLFAHGLLGLGLAGQFLPEDPWDDFGDVEGGARLEWRWDRLSFALTQWTGFPDLPSVKILQPWERNVDPRSGRPRRAGATGPCVAGNEPACLGGVVAGDLVNPDPPALAAFPNLARPPVDDVLAHHHANQQVFATICASTIGISDLLPNGCAFNLWNSQQIVEADADLGVPTPTVAQAFSAMLQGDLPGKLVLGTLARWETDGTLNLLAQAGRLPLVPLHQNANMPPGGGPGSEIDGREVGGFRIFAFRSTDEANPDVCGTLMDPIECSVAEWRTAGLSPALTVAQEALLGCGDHWGTDCDIHGFDLLNSEGSALTQSWPGFEGAGGADWDPFDGGVAQPGTIFFDGGPVCTRFDRVTRRNVVLPGCRGVVHSQPAGNELLVWFHDGYDPLVDGCVFGETFAGLPVTAMYQNDPGAPNLSFCTSSSRSRGGITTQLPFVTPFHPFAGCDLSTQDVIDGVTCTFDVNPTRDYEAEFLAGTAQVFRSEMAALSWNLLMVLVANSLPPDVLGGSSGNDCDATAGPKQSDGCNDRPPRFDEFDVRDPADYPDATPGTIGPERLNGCSFRRPFLCKSAGPFFATTGARRASVRAGGNGRFGRRDFQWHAGASAVLDYDRRNVLGFSLDFPEDRTKTNWGVEFTWFDRVKMVDHDEFDGLRTTQHFNLSVSVDRPTFIRFLNAGRTFLFNSQLFLQYIDGYTSGFTANGPFNALGTLFMATAYHQDRLIPTLTLVHDFNSVSGGAIAGLTYRYNTHFSVTVGAAAFYGRVETAPAALTGIGGASGGAGEGYDRAYVENGLSQIRDRDELSLRFRYTF